MNIYNLFSNILNDNSVLIILVGPPGSGKTDFANKLSDRFVFSKVSPDDIRYALTGDISDQSKNREVFSKVYSTLVEKLKKGENVVYDATNCKSFYREKIITICKDVASTIMLVVMNTPLRVCLERNNKRSRHVPEYIIETYYIDLQYKPPHINEGYDIMLKVEGDYI